MICVCECTSSGFWCDISRWDAVRIYTYHILMCHWYVKRSVYTSISHLFVTSISHLFVTSICEMFYMYILITFWIYIQITLLSEFYMQNALHIYTLHVFIWYVYVKRPEYIYKSHCDVIFICKTLCTYIHTADKIACLFCRI